MNITELTPTQLRKAADLKEEIAKLESQLEEFQGTKAAPVVVAKPAAPKHMKKGPKKMSAQARAKISAAAKARWAKIKAGKK